MKNFLSGLWLIVGLELRQRVRGVSWYVLLGIFVVLVAIVTALLWVVSGITGGDAFGDDVGVGGWLFSLIVYFVLLLGTLVTPALSGNAINGDRDSGTLATTQVTLITTGQLILGKFIAAWVSSLAFLVASLPFVGASIGLGDVNARTLIDAVLLLAVELGVIAAIGVGLSAVIVRPLFSVVVTYLVVAALSLGTLIAFGLGGAVVQSPTVTTYTNFTADSYDDQTGMPIDPVCQPPEVLKGTTPRFDKFWGILAANPYVVVADAAGGDFDSHGNPTNLFSAIAAGVRAVQEPPKLVNTYDECANLSTGDYGPRADNPTMEDHYNGAIPSWFVGLGIHILLAVGALIWGWSRTRTPSKRLAKGSRIA